MPLYPVFLNLKGRICLVVGGGTVGMRKATSLLEAGTRVRLVCLESPTSNVPPGIDWIKAPYSSMHLEKTCFAFAAATVDVNRNVVADANELGIWVNSASDPESGDFLVPASRSLGRIELAVSTGGAAPALAAYIRDYLASHIDDAMIAWVDLLATLRQEVQARLPPSARYAVLRELADPNWLNRIRSENVEAVLNEMRAVVNREAKR